MTTLPWPPWWGSSWLVSGWPQVCSWCSWLCWHIPACSESPADTQTLKHIFSTYKLKKTVNLFFFRLGEKKIGQTSRLEEDGDTVAMIDVFVRPPRESCSILVSLDSLEDKTEIFKTSPLMWKAHQIFRIFIKKYPHLFFNNWSDLIAGQ